LVQALQMAHAQQPADPVKRFGLTARELEVIARIVEGYSNKEIANRFSISEQTVKHHLRSIFDKLGVSNRLELALFSVNNNLTNKRS
jgi:two-component system, NarL family, nitrate/nitrite response regulator NarL